MSTATHSGNYEIVKSLADAPNFKGARKVYLDFETTDPNHESEDVATHAYQGGRACGFSVTVDDCPKAYYFPMRHSEPPGGLFGGHASLSNLDVKGCIGWASELLKGAHAWVNHNVRFDAHMLTVDGGSFGGCELHDTLVQAKMVDQQANKGGYGLKPLFVKWCDGEAGERDEVRDYLERLAKQYKCPKLYGYVPVPTLGRYACADVLQNRALEAEIHRRRYEGDERIWKIETDLTPALFRMEQRGLRVDWDRLEDKRRQISGYIARLSERFSRLTGQHIDMNKPDHIREILYGYCGFPVLVKTDSGLPSTKEDAIVECADWAKHEGLDEEKIEIAEELRTFAHRSQFLKLYINGWTKRRGLDDRLHYSFNQLLRTGRMACADPNMQQLSLEAKLFVIPDQEGYGFVRFDYSQVEYRIMGGLVNDQRVIDAYRNDADTDFHQFVADLCGIGRKPAKSINFGMGFGMGEEKLLIMLARILGGEGAAARASEVYQTYHRTFPNIKAMFKKSELLCYRRGYIKTLYGRRRCLGGPNSLYPERGRDGDFTRNAFNTAVQGTAADIIKEITTPLEAHQHLVDHDIDLRALIHDEALAHGPLEALAMPETQRAFEIVMTNPTIDLPVPLAIDGGFSGRSWAHADEGELRKMAIPFGLDPETLDFAA